MLSHRIARLYALAVVLVAPLCPSTAAAETASRKPNIIIIVSDDQGYGDLGCYGSEVAITPNLDRLAGQGTRLTDFYVTHPSCTPSRAGLLTGRYPQRYGAVGALLIGHHASFSKDKKWHGGIPVTERILPELLKQEGYATGCFGKWHLGYGPGKRPDDRGFDRTLVCAGGMVDYFTGDFFGAPDIYRNGKLIDFSGYTTDAFADEAIEFIREKKAQPFFVYLPFNAVHYSVPGATEKKPSNVHIVQAPKEALAGFSEFDKQRQHYLAALKLMDIAIGRVLEAVESSGQAENTLVIFFSDNGGDLDFGGNNDPLRGEKATIWDGGIRVPAIVRWPGKIKAGSTCRTPLMQLDFFNMALAAGGAVTPTDRPIDGRDPTAILINSAGRRGAPLFFSYRNHRAIRDGRYKLLQLAGQAVRLFDLEQDPGEQTNLAKQDDATVKRLNSSLREWQNGLPKRPQPKKKQK